MFSGLTVGKMSGVAFLREAGDVLLVVARVFLFFIGKSIYCGCVRDAYNLMLRGCLNVVD
jgi:hypothetical protein